jgi:signal peptidase
MYSLGVEKSTKHTIIGAAAIMIFVVAVFAGIYTASGVSPPQTIVISESMQHGMHSQLGIIDTGDMVILRSKGSEEDMGIQSFVDGHKNGYSMFGGYGDVIIYERPGGGNPIIHRAILWLELNEDGETWSAPSLEGYPSDLWSCEITDASGHVIETISDYTALHGQFKMKNLGYNQDITASINLGSLINGSHSGFLTMGDNNKGFDQGSSITSELISYNKIKSVAWIEVPWVGSFKMALDGNMSKLNEVAPNTIPSAIAATLLLVFVLAGISFLFDYRYYGKYKKEMYEDMNALPPSFPVEDEKD